MKKVLLFLAAMLLSTAALAVDVARSDVNSAGYYIVLTDQPCAEEGYMQARVVNASDESAADDGCWSLSLDIASDPPELLLVIDWGNDKGGGIREYDPDAFYDVAAVGSSAPTPEVSL